MIGFLEGCTIDSRFVSSSIWRIQNISSVVTCVTFGSTPIIPKGIRLHVELILTESFAK